MELTHIDRNGSAVMVDVSGKPMTLRKAVAAATVKLGAPVLALLRRNALPKGDVLAVARIAGETAPLIFTALGNAFGVQGLLEPIGALPLQIYRYALSPYADWQKQAWAAAFLLVMLVLGINIVVRLASGRNRK